jgi:hypothetical protein
MQALRVRLIQDPFEDAVFGENYANLSRQFPASADCLFKFHQRSQLFIRAHDEALSVGAMRTSNEERPPVGIPRLSSRSQQEKCFALTHHRSLITYHILERAVSSVVEHLVYTERVGGSKPSPPKSRIAIADFRFSIESPVAHETISRTSFGFRHSCFAISMVQFVSIRVD